uniref:Uncharacterized protein n=1 Tax=viral metagenome TaxID=1070528 RepID=A0A6M3LK82_9ZZZZ
MAGTALTDRLEAAHYRPAEAESCADCGHVEVVGFEHLVRCLKHDSFVARDKTCDYYVSATCNFCLWGHGVRYRGGNESDDFSCHNNYVPYDQRIIKTPDTPSCPEYMPVQLGHRQRIEIIQAPPILPKVERPPWWAQKHDEYDPGLTPAQFRADVEAGRKEDKGLGRKERYDGRFKDI